MIQLAEEQDSDDDFDESGLKDGEVAEDAGGDAELDLAAYERLLVEQELRLRTAQSAQSGDVVATKSEPSGGSQAGLIGTTSPTSQPSQEPSPSPPQGVGKTATTKTTKSKKSKKSKKKKSSKNRPSAGGASGYGGGRASPSRTPNEEPSPCVTICEIARTTCDLEERICDLASRHPGEERYAQVCQRASDDCELAQSACESCMV